MAIRGRSTALLLTLIVLTGLFGFQRYRKIQIDRLYARSAGYASMGLGFVTDPDAVDAVADLAAYRGTDVTHLLLNIASGKERFGSAVRIIAIHHVRTRGTADEAAALATLLQPHQTLDLRQAVAQAIEGMPCNKGCVASILHYFERVFAGQKNQEDMLEDFLVSRTDPSIGGPRRDYSRSQKHIYDLLEDVLKRERSRTLEVLLETYGLVSEFPSPFALEIVSRTQLDESCPFLIMARKATGGDAFRDEKLIQVIETLACDK
jgi:hypothetical protein